MSCARCVPMLMVVLAAAAVSAAEWQPKQAPLMTRWAKDVDPRKTLPEYPRPQMVREQWQNLNGLWDYALTEGDADRPSRWDGQILVPFPIESALSGVMRRVEPDQRLWYRRTVELSEPRNPKDNARVLLHFGAVDWQSEVWVNGKSVGTHRGGYDPFTFDITDALKDGPSQEIVVAVNDPTTQGTQPVGKQNLKPGGIWYTPTTGIWQTVWLERVPRISIEALTITPDVDQASVKIRVRLRGAKDDLKGLRVVAGIPRQGNTKSGTGVAGFLATGEAKLADGAREADVTIQLDDPKLWSPESSYLYDLRISVDEDGLVFDHVSSYFALRKISLGKDDQGVTRLMLNNKPLFQYGFLDQGFWPDGLYTAPTDEALRYDIEITKKLGMNLARKHVKVEPARWYYWCDKLGLLVWQDMPSGDRHIGRGKPDIQRSKESAADYEREWKAIIDALRNHPCIVMWVPFNEGWGQFDTARIAELTKRHDPTRLVNSASGWVDRGVGDVHDIHVYPGPGMPAPEPDRAAVLGEFGGLGLPIKGHTWQDEKNWGYRTFKTQDDLTEAYLSLVSQLRSLIGRGLSAAVYTQTTDVEVEVNGMMTYDRAILKMPLEEVAAAHAKLHLPPPKVTTILPTSETEPQTWRYTTQAPPENWTQSDFDDSGWKEGQGGFGRKETPGAVVRTAWTTPDIWLRRTFTLPENPHVTDMQLRIHHDEDADVYLNGHLIARVQGYSTEYMTLGLQKRSRAALQPGRNTLAVHCHQTGGGQYIDVGLVDVKEVNAGR